MSCNRILCLTIVVSFVACSGSDDPQSLDGSQRDATQTTDDSSTDDARIPTSDGTGPVADSATDGSPPVELGPGVVTVAGSAEPGSEDGFRTEARFSNPVNVAVGPTGDLFVADYDTSLIRRVTPDGAVRTITPAPTELRNPFGLVFAGNELYFQNDLDDAALRETGSLWTMDPEGGAPSLVLDGTGRWRGMAALPDGRLVVADFGNHVLKIVDPKGKTVDLLAGTEEVAGYSDGQGSAAQFNQPYDVVLISASEVVVSDKGNDCLRKVTLSGDVTRYAGDCEAEVDQSKDGALLDAQFNGPQGLAVDADGNIYVADTGGHVIRKISAGQVTTIAGSGQAGFADAKNPLQAKFFGMEGIDVTPDGRYLYIADGTAGEVEPYHRLRRLEIP